MVKKTALKKKSVTTSKPKAKTALKVQVQKKSVKFAAPKISKPSKSAAAHPEIVSDDDDLNIPELKKVPVRPGEVDTQGLDALQKYLIEIRKHPLLSPEEERKLAIHYKKTGDRLAAEKLVTSNLRFVVKVAAEYSKFGARMIDLIQEGNVGLMHAVREFNPYKGVKLITYAVWWIRGYIQEYLMKNYSQVKIGTTQAQKKLFYHLNREKARLDAMGTTPDVKLLSSNLGVTEEEVTEMQKRMSGRDVSLDTPMDSEDSGARRFVENQVDANSTSIDDDLARAEEHEIFQREIGKVLVLLNEKEKYILEKRILSDPPLTLQEVGDHFKITRERARQLEERVIEKIRTHFVKVFPDYKINLPKE